MNDIFRASVLVLALSLPLSSALGQGLWISVDGGAWQPSEETITYIQNNIKTYATSAAALQSRQLHDWSEYTFQYRGEEEHGSRYVLVNALCGPPPKQANRELLFVLDGGSCYFTLKYDPVKSQFYDLKINGEA